MRNMLNKAVNLICTHFNKSIFILALFWVSLFVISADQSSDQIPDQSGPGIENEKDELQKQILKNFDFTQEKLKKRPLTFQMGGAILLKSRLLIGRSSTYFQLTPAGGFEPAPNNKWQAFTGAELWGRISGSKSRFLHFKFNGLFKYDHNAIVPIFNFEELYLNWDYKFGQVKIGRTNYNLKSTLAFNGPLDAVQLIVNIPYLNFKSFIGYSGFLGLFHPWYNPYNLTAFDRTFVNLTNLVSSVMVVQLNAIQARRIFLGMDYDIHFYGQHFVPYMLLQFDVSSLPLPNFSNNDYTINTFHFGINIEGRIVSNIYYKIDFAGSFGTNHNVQTNQFKPIIGCGLLTELRFSIPRAKYSTFVLSYAFGTGTPNKSTSFWDDTTDAYSSKFYYFGQFNGGFVLSPVLSNIHSISLKYLITPINNAKGKFSLYAAFFQTFKMFYNSRISDDQCNLADYVVGSEIDFGFTVSIKKTVSLGIDSGILFPETAYTDKTPRIRLGSSMTISF